MNPTRCSIVIPTRDCLDYLREAIASVAMQDVADIEILVVDDGSSDGTSEWLAHAARLDSRIVATRTEGIGPSGARNIAISQAKSPFIAFLDADDLWWPRKLQKQLAFHEAHPEVAFSFTDYLHIDPDGGLHGTCFEFWAPPFIAGHGREFFTIPDAEFELLATNVAGTSTVMASRIALQNAKGFANHNVSAEDWELWLRLAAKGEVACSTAVTTTYLMRPGSLTQNKPARLAALDEIVGHYAGCRDPMARTAVRLAKRRISIARGELERGNRRYLAAATHHGRAFLAQPTLRIARAMASDLVKSVVELGRGG
jgi:hypothetical protein